MIGFTLARYFFARYVVITFWFFTGVATLVFIINFTEISGRVSTLSSYSSSLALTIALMQTPMYMLDSAPFIGLITGVATLISLNRKYELVVARAAGISAWQFLAPICAGALAFGLAVQLGLNPLAAAGLERATAMDAELRAGSAVANTDAASPWIKQRTSEGETIIGAGSVLSQGLELVDATFLRIDPDGNLFERVEARRAHLREGHWELVQATRIREGTLPSTVESMQIDTNLTPEFVLERLARPETISIYELPRKIAAARSFGLGAHALATHFHSLMALPALLMAMTVIAATVSMRFARMGQSGPIILGGILAGFLLYVMTVLVKAFGSAGIVPPVMAAWSPVLVASFIGITFLLYKEDG